MNHVILLLSYVHHKKFRIFYVKEGDRKDGILGFWSGYFVAWLQHTQNIRFSRKEHGLLADRS